MSELLVADQTTFAAIVTRVSAAPWVPLDSAVAEQLAGIAVRVGFCGTDGDFMNKIKLAPTATLLEFVIYFTLAVTLEGHIPDHWHTMSLADQATVAQIISQIGAAPWVPFDATSAEQLASIAVRGYFDVSTGDFMARISKSPTAALLEFALYAAGNMVLES